MFGDVLKELRFILLLVWRQSKALINKCTINSFYRWSWPLTVWSYHRIRPTRCRTGWCPRNIDSTTRTLISITLCIYL